MRDKGFQGICFDVLNEVEALTGLRFELLNDQIADWVGIIKMLEDGEVSMISELIRTPERMGRFLWPEAAVLTDYPALLSKLEFRNININEIPNVKVGLINGYAHTELFVRWFPDHGNTVRYANFDQAFGALSRGEVDMMMGSQNQLLIQTNFRELPGYKANIVFDFPFESTFGFNKNEAVLCSIISKAMRQIDIKGIAGQWTRRTYDYRRKLAESQLPWLYGVIVLLLFVLILWIALFFKRRQAEHAMLEVLQREQKYEAEKTIFDRLNSMKTEFLGNISHELKTPLAIISSHAQLTRQHEQENELPDDYVVNKMLLISSEAERTAALVERILDITRIEEGRLSLTLKMVNIEELIKDMVNTFYPILNKNNNKIVIEPCSEACDVLCDRERVIQVLLNLISNAVRFTRNGTVTVKAKTEDADCIAVSVSDTGSGISKDRLPYIFDRYHTKEPTGSDVSTGTGLGLYISKHIIEEHGGTVSVESEPGVGTTVMFRLPKAIQGTEANNRGE
jgi:signal transduction histidine kinase